MSTQLHYDPELTAALEPIADRLHSGPKPAVGDVAARRRNALESFLIGRLPKALDVSRKDHKITSRDGTEFTLAEFRKAGAVSSKAVLYIHGGGMIRGSVDAFQRAIENNCSHSGVVFLCPEYRLAPEHPYPSAIDDCFAALQWTHQNAAELQIDSGRIIVMGESAGGGLAAGTVLMARDKGLSPAPLKQILTFPMLDDKNQVPIPGIEPLATWNCDDNITDWTALLGNTAGTDAVSEYAAPARAATLEGLPPTYIECGQLDIFSFENLKYATRLMEARVPLEFHIYPGQPHAFMALAPDTKYSRLAVSNVLAAIASA